MKILDEGHKYELDHVDSDGHETVTFIKRSGEHIKHDDEYPGTNSQELLRVLIDRTKYLNDQLTCDESGDIIYYLRQALFIYEARAYRRKQQGHNRKDINHEANGERYKDIPFVEWNIELLPTEKDGHISV
jgi:hypothetical protein